MHGGVTADFTGGDEVGEDGEGVALDEGEGVVRSGLVVDAGDGEPGPVVASACAAGAGVQVEE